MLTAYDSAIAGPVDTGDIDMILVGDLPFLSYGASIEQSVQNAGRFLKEAGQEL
jgi:3-methyl-2-oxobutanoate hydroxymethyltransferase